MRYRIGKTLVSIVAWAAMVLAMMGCQSDGNLPPPVTGWTSRFDHLHNKAYQDHALAARDTFKPQQAALDPILTANLQASRNAQSAVLDVEAQAADTALAMLTIDITWAQLHERLLSDIGLAGSPGRSSDEVLGDRISLRQVKLTAVLKVLVLIAEVQGGLARQAVSDLEEARDALGRAQKAATQPVAPDPPGESPATTPPAVQPATTQSTTQPATTRVTAVPTTSRARTKAEIDQERKSRVEWFEKVLSALLKAGQATRDDAAVRAKATLLQQELLGAVERSRDPAVAYALVAIVGTGLDDRSLFLLDQYIAYLHGHLKDIAQAPGEVEPRVQQAFNAARMALNDESLEPAQPVGPKDVGSFSGPGLLGRLSIRERAANRAPAVNGAPVAPAAPKTVKPTSFTAAKANDWMIEALQKLEETREHNEGIVRPARPSAAVAGQHDLGVVIAAAKGESVIARRQAPFTDTAAQRAAPPKGKKPASKAKVSQDDAALLAIAAEFLKGVEAGSPANVTVLQDRLQEMLKGAAAKLPLEKIRQEDLKFIGAFVNDIGRLALESRARALELWRDLIQVQVDLTEENVRHTGALTAIAGAELKRWVLLAALNDDYGTALRQRPQREADELTIRRARGAGQYYPLFATRSELKAAEDAYVQGLPQGSADPYAQAVMRHPAVALEDYVLASIRQLAETARAWHNASTSADPSGRNLAVSNERLVQAVRVVHGHLLMVSVNARSAGQNRLQLTDELDTHAFRLDSLNGQIQEAGFRLTLNDLAAFHSTGITEEDLRAIEAAGLYYLGYRAGK